MTQRSPFNAGDTERTSFLVHSILGQELLKWLHRDGSSAQRGPGFESTNVYSIS